VTVRLPAAYPSAHQVRKTGSSRVTFILTDACVVTVNDARDVLDRASVLVRGDRIAEIGSGAALKRIASSQGGQGLIGLDPLEQRNEVSHSLSGSQAELGSIAADGVGQLRAIAN
jgi:hypothetical protein